jgi:DNA-binding MarR family transcriptional regulator
VAKVNARGLPVPPNLPATLQTAMRLHAAALHLLIFLRKEDEASGVTPSRLSALSIIVFEGPIAPGDVARIQQVKAPTMTRLVAALEKQGLIRRVADPGDGRAAKLSATRKGKDLMQAARMRRLVRLGGALEKIDSRKIARLAEALPIFDEIVRNLAVPVHASES